ncbi:MAG: LysM peptidoglycan-binding domain-containing protein [Sulfurihydrogenibium azorense]|uniref:LysM peptidoglycan-binding domain-containing protein n=1 Tax=Sulfurihydrogenibium azorense TaxID=309806 RepID=UPI003919BBF8
MSLKSSIKLGLISALIPFMAMAEVYEVKKGDTLEKIAKKYNVSIEDIKKANNIKDEKKLREGMKLKIPVKTSKQEKKKKVEVVEETYTVKKGDTLETIAKKYGITVKEIMDYNNMKDEKIFAGDELKIPLKGSEKKKEEKKEEVTTPSIDYSKCEVYTLKKGGTLKHVSKRTGVDVSILEKLNDIPSNQWLKAGTKVCLAPKKEKVEEKAPKSQDLENCTIIYNPTKKISLEEIARKFHTSTKKIREINNLPSSVKYVDSGQKVCVAVEDVSKSKNVVIEEKRETLKEEPKVKEETPTKEVPMPKKVEPKVANGDSLGIKLDWPVRGKVVAPFQNDDQVRHLGIDIQTECGAPVRASEDGKVIYAGDGIKAFGNLVVIRHNNGLTTVYGYLNSINVKEGRVVTKGETIGSAGKLKNSDNCGIYFEVRKNVTPLDPMTVLE